MTFPNAEQPWVPTLVDVERMKAAEPDDSPVDWRRFGWSALEVPQDCPNIASRFDSLGTRFLERYAYRMLNSETMERWQVRLQNRFDEVVHVYERAYVLYDENKDSMKELLPGLKTVTSGENSSEGSTSGDGRSRASVTPDQGINDSDDYAGSVTKTESSGKSSNNAKTSGQSVVTYTGSTLTENVNKAVWGWKDLDTAFVSEFENLFMNVWWY